MTRAATKEVVGATFCGAFQAREEALGLTIDLMDSPWKVLPGRWGWGQFTLRKITPDGPWRTPEGRTGRNMNPMEEAAEALSVGKK